MDGVSNDSHFDAEEESRSFGVHDSEDTDPSVPEHLRTENESLHELNRTENSVDALAKGLSSLLSTVIRNFDYRAEEAMRSQDQLTSTLDRLTGELDQLLEDAPSPFIMQHAAKISGIRKRVSALNSLLRSIQGRIDNIDRMLSMYHMHGSYQGAPVFHSSLLVKHNID